MGNRKIQNSQLISTMGNQGIYRSVYREGKAELTAKARRKLGGGGKAKAKYFRKGCKDKKTSILSGGSRDSWSRMGNPKLQSSQFVSKVNDGIYRPDYREGDDELIAKRRKECRKHEAKDFRKEYYYGRCKDKKICIWSDGRDSWADDPSSGITWVGVHGKDSICVVAKTGDLDVSRVHGFLIFSLVDEVFRNFRRAVISEIEDLADRSSKLREMHVKHDKGKKPDKGLKTPFGVVSVVPPSDKIHKASCYRYKEKKLAYLILEDIKREEALGDGHNDLDEDDDSDFDEYKDRDALLKYMVKLSRRSRRTAPLAKDIIPGYHKTKTVKYLQDKMKSGETINEIDQESGDKYYVKKATNFLEKKMTKSVEDFTVEETVKTAISAFQCLFNKNFKADQIQVSVMDPNYSVLCKGSRFKDIYVNHLETKEIEKYLSDMSEPESEGSPCSSWSFTFEGSTEGSD